MTTKDIEIVLGRVRTWPKKRQEDAARLLEMLEEADIPSYRLTDAQVREVRRIKRGWRTGKTRFATEREMAALWKKFGL
jgi:hypothetical protein